MTTAKKLTKAQKADLAVSETKALSGHHVALAGGTLIGASISVDPDAQIKSEILNGIDQAQQRATEEFEAEVLHILEGVSRGAVATITGDLKRGFLRDRHNNDHPNKLVVALVEHGLLDPGWYRGVMIPTSIYHLRITDAGRDYLAGVKADG
ncbi:hypothetical protein [Escherichia phage KW1E_UTAR]|nr:hypothetical protein [Escherichia phage KW1E_UTAR]